MLAVAAKASGYASGCNGVELRFFVAKGSYFNYPFKKYSILPVVGCVY